MARIRSVKPEYFTHPDVLALSIPARLMYIALWTQADDEGRLYDQPTKIRGLAFGDDDKIDVEKILRELAAPSRCDECAERHGHILRYITDARRCLQVVHFRKHQRIDKPSRSTVPAWDPETGILIDDSASVRGTFRESSTNDPGTLPKSSIRTEIGSREQGSREQGTGNARGATDAPGFAEFWRAYPNKTGKRAAVNAWRKLRPPLDAVLAALAWQVGQPQWLRDGGDFIPHPATWLNRGSWQDEPMALPTNGRPAKLAYVANPSRIAALMSREHPLTPDEAEYADRLIQEKDLAPVTAARHARERTAQREAAIVSPP